MIAHETHDFGRQERVPVPTFWPIVPNGELIDIQYDHHVLIRCTAKLQKAIGTPATALVDGPPSEHDWNANLLWSTGRKCVLLTHAGTLFSVFVPDVRVVDLRPFGRFAVQILETALRSERLATVPSAP